MRLPRKLKKGCRTLNGNPRTKWQRKGRLHIAKTLQQVADTACAAAVGMDLLRQAAERIHPVTFPSGDNTGGGGGTSDNGDLEG